MVSFPQTITKEQPQRKGTSAAAPGQVFYSTKQFAIKNNSHSATDAISFVCALRFQVGGSRKLFHKRISLQQLGAAD